MKSSAAILIGLVLTASQAARSPGSHPALSGAGTRLGKMDA